MSWDVGLVGETGNEVGVFLLELLLERPWHTFDEMLFLRAKTYSMQL
jgi:hypothetical protein